MKKPGLIALCIVVLTLYFHAGVLAQHTLQFNQVKLVGTVETVPTDKVWKIESMLPSSRLTTYYCSSSTSCSYSQTQHIILVNGTNVFMASADAAGSAYGVTTNALMLNTTIWLPAGTTLAAGTGVFKISVIEFNIIAP
jgi:hypothetical protein